MKLKNLLLVCSLFLAGGVVATSGEQANSVREVAAETKTVKLTSFTATSASMDSVVKYSTAKGGGTSDPAVNSNEIRLYQNANGTGGGTLTLTAATGYKLSGAVIGSSMATSVAYTTDSNTTKLNKKSISANGKYTLTDLDCSSVTFYCMGNDKNSRLYVNYLEATWTDGNETAATADAFLAAVNAIPANPTLDDVAKVQTAREEYNKIKSEADLVASSAVVTALNKVVSAETAIAALVDEKINAIGVVDSSKIELITEAREAYSSLTDEMKALVENLDVLTGAEETLKEFSVSQVFTDSAKDLETGITKGPVSVKHTKGSTATTTHVPMRLYAGSKLNISVDTEFASGITCIEMLYQSENKPNVACTFTPASTNSSVKSNLYTFDFANVPSVLISFASQVRLTSFTVYYTKLPWACQEFFEWE